ncbi:hypothetical protein GF406_13135 [candidate division KSB1 bacterium]|nr:hypothetical protein [candidate division KSB1 bacterium]
MMTIQAIETTAIIKDQKQLLLDEPISLRGGDKVRLIILLPEENDIDHAEWLSAAAANPVFDDLNDPAEDLYTDADGKPFSDQG